MCISEHNTSGVLSAISDQGQLVCRANNAFNPTSYRTPAGATHAESSKIYMNDTTEFVKNFAGMSGGTECHNIWCKHIRRKVSEAKVEHGDNRENNFGLYGVETYRPRALPVPGSTIRSFSLNQ